MASASSDSASSHHEQEAAQQPRRRARDLRGGAGQVIDLALLEPLLGIH